MHLDCFVEHKAWNADSLSVHAAAVLIQPVSDILRSGLGVEAVDVLERVLLLAARHVELAISCSQVVTPLTVGDYEPEATVLEDPALAAVRMALDFADGESFHFLLLGFVYMAIIPKILGEVN